MRSREKERPRMSNDADVIVVGAGLAGLVATAELADAGRTVLLLDQEPEQSLGGQAFWSFGGLFLVDSPEQRRMRHPRLARAGLAGLAGHRRASTATRTTGRGSGPRPTSTSPPARSAPGCTSRACAGLPGRRLGRARRLRRRSATATRCRASTSPGAPARASSSRSSAACAPRREPGLVALRFRHRVDELIVDRRRGHRRARRRCSSRATSARGASSSRVERRRLRARAPRP